MITGIARDVINEYERGINMQRVTKGLLTKLLTVHEARKREDWATHHKLHLPQSGRSIEERESEIMYEVERYIIKKCGK